MRPTQRVAYGDNLLEVTYSGLKGWYEKSIPHKGAKGFFERVGKAIVVMPAHLMLSIFQTVFMIFYDCVATLVFSVAALCTGFKKRSINNQVVGHLGSLGAIPGKALKHLAAAFCPPATYRSDHIQKAQYEYQYEEVWSKEIYPLAVHAYKNGYLFNKSNPQHYVDYELDRAEVEPRFSSTTMKSAERRIIKIPFGSSLNKVSYSTFKSWYEASSDKKTVKGNFEKVGKALLLMPAHLLLATIQSIAMAIYDLVLGIIFSLAALLTGFQKYVINRQALGHLGSLSQFPGVAIKNLTAAFCPPLAYRSDNERFLQYHFQFPQIWAKETPQFFKEKYQLIDIDRSYLQTHHLRLIRQIYQDFARQHWNTDKLADLFSYGYNLIFRDGSADRSVNVRTPLNGHSRSAHSLSQSQRNSNNLIQLELSPEITQLCMHARNSYHWLYSTIQTVVKAVGPKIKFDIRVDNHTNSGTISANSTSTQISQNRQTTTSVNSQPSQAQNSAIINHSLSSSAPSHVIITIPAADSTPLIPQPQTASSQTSLTSNDTVIEILPNFTTEGNPPQSFSSLKTLKSLAGWAFGGAKNLLSTTSRKNESDEIFQEVPQGDDIV